MNERLCCGGLLLASTVLGGCGASVYTPRPSPRIQIVPEGSSPVLVRDGRRYSVSMFGGGLEEAVQGNAQAEEEARSYKAKGVTGFVFATLGSICGGVGAGLLVGNELQANPSTELTIGSLSMVVGGLVMSIVGSVITAGAQPHLWNAINVYNDGLPAGGPPWPGPPGYPGYPARDYGPGPVPLPYSGAPLPPGAPPSALPPPLPSSAVPVPAPPPR
jgi:hypothetical protein